MLKRSQITFLKGTSGRKKVKLKWKRVKNSKKRAITDLNAPNGSRDIPFQSQEFGQDGHRHFVGFQPHFQLNMTSQTQYCKTMKKWKWNIPEVFCLICLKLCRFVRTWQRNFASFKILLLWQPESKLLSIIEKQKVYCLTLFGRGPGVPHIGRGGQKSPPG